MVTEMYLPKLGQTMEEGRIVNWLKTEGDTVKKGDIVLEVETDKSVLEVEAEGEGIIRKILVRENETVPIGTILGYIADAGDELPDGSTDVASESENDKTFKGVYEIDRTEEMTPLRKQMSRRLKTSLENILNTSATIEVDAHAIREFYKKSREGSSFEAKTRITYNDIFVAIVAKALREYPQFNSICDGNSISYVRNINIGIAVGVEGGVMVPVIRNADTKTMEEISHESRYLAEKAHSGRLLPEEYSHGTFTISNLGMFGIDSFIPIINPPESAILGIGGVIEKPRAVMGQIVIRSVVKITLNYDHRVADGVSCSGFLNVIKKMCEELDR